MLGFHQADCKKVIDVKKTIIDSLNQIFESCKDPNMLPLDLVVDAGVSNIAQYYETMSSSVTKSYDEKYVNDGDWKLMKDPLSLKSSTAKWQQVIKMFDSFCKNVRKDCMFIADGLRPFCLIGDSKIVRPTKVGASVEKDVLPYIRHISGINSSYSAGYVDWF